MPNGGPTYEELVTELEALIKSLQTPLTLEEQMRVFVRASEISFQCYQWLSHAEKTMREIQKQ